MVDKIKFISFFAILGFVFSFILCIIFRVSFFYLILRLIFSTAIMTVLGFLVSIIYEKYLHVELASSEKAKQANSDSSANLDEGANLDSNVTFSGASKSTLDKLENDIAKKVVDKTISHFENDKMQDYNLPYESYSSKISKTTDAIKDQFDGEIMAKAIRKEIKED